MSTLIKEVGGDREIPTSSRLPLEARNFINQQLAAQEEQEDAIESIELKVAYQKIRRLLRELNAPIYTMTLFRDLHRHTFQENSVAWLHLDDDVLLRLITQGVYFVKELEQKLANGTLKTDQEALQRAVAEGNAYLLREKEKSDFPWSTLYNSLR